MGRTTLGLKYPCPGDGRLALGTTKNVLVRDEVPTVRIRPRNRLGASVALASAIACAFLLFPRAGGATIFDLAPQSTFTLVNFNADGFVSMHSDTIVLTGGNNLSLEPGTTDYVATAVNSGTVNLNWSYSSLDMPTFDFAGYLLNGNFVPLADSNGMSAVAVVAILSGQTFGFRVGTVDNSGEPGILTITSTATTIPEPGSAVPFLVLTIVSTMYIVRNRFNGVEIRNAIRRSIKLLLPPLAATGVCVQGQLNINYTGTNITGQVVLSGPHVNLLGLSQQLQAPAARTKGAAARRSPVIPRPEETPKTAPKFLPPPPPSHGLSARVSVSHGASSRVAVSAGVQNLLAIVPAAAGFGFNGLTHFDQRNANHGNQYSVEPPNPSLAVGNGYILEGVNNAIQVYSVSGTPLLAMALASNQVFGLPPAINRVTGISGVFPTDMRVFYDQGINRWFIVQRAQCCDSAGNNVNHSQIYIAVSQAGDPTGIYNNYVIDTTDSNRSGCPYGCVADYPQIGADQYGFYISSDEYPIAPTGDPSLYPIGATILAISKTALASGASLPTAYEFRLPVATGFEFAISPAVTPPGASYSLGQGGVEFFVSSIATGASSLSVWAMTNTSSLDSASPHPALARMVVPTQPYTPPPNALQRPGPLPYGSTQIPGFEAPIDSSDCRMLSLVAAAGRLYAAFDTLVTDANGRVLAGGAFFILSPTFRGALGATVLSQGYLSVNNNYLLRPAFAVTAKGKGAIALTLVGPDYYPSAAFVTIAPVYSLNGTLLGYSPGAVQVASPGVFPEDGFTGYQTGVARWGDYSSAVTDSDGSLWMVTEYIPNGPRTTFANWGTFLVQYMP